RGARTRRRRRGRAHRRRRGLGGAFGAESSRGPASRGESAWSGKSRPTTHRLALRANEKGCFGAAYSDPARQHRVVAGLLCRFVGQDFQFTQFDFAFGGSERRTPEAVGIAAEVFRGKVCHLRERRSEIAALTGHVV